MSVEKGLFRLPGPVDATTAVEKYLRNLLLRTVAKIVTPNFTSVRMVTGERRATSCMFGQLRRHSAVSPHVNVIHTLSSMHGSMIGDLLSLFIFLFSVWL